MSQIPAQLKAFLHALRERSIDDKSVPVIEQIQVKEVQTMIEGMREFIVVLNQSDAYSIWQNPTGEWGWEPYNHAQHMGFHV